MIFENIANGSLTRQNEARALLYEAKRIEKEAGPLASDLMGRMHKGLFFILLYGTVEYTVTQCCMTFISHIKEKPYLALDYKNKLVSIILSSEFEAFSACGAKEKWNKKSGVIDSLYSRDRSRLSETTFPGEVSNIGVSQLRAVWEYFHLPGEPFADKRNINLDEVKNNRNTVAHGRRSAENVGKGYTTRDLEKKLKAVENLCGYVVEAFEYSCENKHFLKQT